MDRRSHSKGIKDVFEGLGHTGTSSSFVVNPDHTPLQHAPRRVAVTLQKQIKEKIAEMENKGIIQNVTEPTDWIRGMVVVAKFGKIKDQRSNIRCHL